MATPDDNNVDDVFDPGGRLRPDLLSGGAAAAVQEAVRLACETRWDSLRSPHIFMGLLAVPDGGVRNWGERLRADLPELLGKFKELFHLKDGDPRPLILLSREFLSDNALRLFRDAHNRAREQHRSQITPMDLLICLLTSSQSIVAECFERIGLTAAKLTELAVMAEQHADRP